MLIITTSDGIKALMSVIFSVFHCWSLSIIIKLPSKNPSFLFMVIFIFTMRNRVTSYFYKLLFSYSFAISDTNKTSRGFLTLKAYRLTPQAINMYKENDFSPEALRTLKIGYESLLMEVPIVIKNSSLTNILLSELQDNVPPQEGSGFLDLGSA